MVADSYFRVQRQLFARSERVKGIDFHPTEPWVSSPLLLSLCDADHALDSYDFI